MDATATEQRRAGRRSRAARERGAAARRRPPRPGREAVFIAPACRCRRSSRATARRSTSWEARDEYVELGEVEPQLLARALRGLPRVLLRAVLHRAALDEAERGRRRLGPRDGRRDAGRHAAAPRLSGRGGVARSSSESSCPVLVIHGRDDAVRPYTRGARLAELAGGELVVLEGSGHLPHARDPVAVNLLIRDFIGAAARDRRRDRTRADARPLSGRGGLRRARRRARLLRGLRLGAPTILLFPTSPISHSRHWKAQIPFLARHFRVVTFDPRGNGRSDRPQGAEAYAIREFVADGPRCWTRPRRSGAVLVGLLRRRRLGAHARRDHPERVAGVAFDRAMPSRWRRRCPNYTVYPFAERLDTDEGWAKYNIHYWQRDYRDFLEFFFWQRFTEPHSTKPIEDAIGGDSRRPLDVLADRGAPRHRSAERRRLQALCGRIRCPVLVVHGDEDNARRASARSRSPSRPAGRSSRLQAPATCRRLVTR